MKNTIILLLISFQVFAINKDGKYFDGKVKYSQKESSVNPGFINVEFTWDKSVSKEVLGSIVFIHQALTCKEMFYNEMTNNNPGEKNWTQEFKCSKEATRNTINHKEMILEQCFSNSDKTSIWNTNKEIKKLCVEYKKLSSNK